MASKLDSIQEMMSHKMFYTPRDFYKFVRKRDATGLAWALLGLLGVSILMVIFVFVAPGWAWTREIHTQENFEGSMYGHYGLWWSCWSLTEHWYNSDEDCELMLDLPKLPFWWKICQALSICQLLPGIALVTVAVVYCCVDSAARRIPLLYSIIIMCILEVLVTMAMLAVWCVLFLYSVYWCCPSRLMWITDWKLGYSFIACCFIPFLYFFSSLLAWREIYNLRAPLRVEAYHRKVASTRRKWDHYAQFRSEQSLAPFSPPTVFQDAVLPPTDPQTYMYEPTGNGNRNGKINMQLADPLTWDDETRRQLKEQEALGTEWHPQRQHSEQQQAAEPEGTDELDLTAMLSY